VLCFFVAHGINLGEKKSFDFGRQLGHCRGLEQTAQREIDSEGVAQPRDHLSGE
jgi:hypothetical protein